MRRRLAALFAWLALVAGLGPVSAQPPSPVRYTVRFVARSAHLADVEAEFPTDGRASIDLMMAIWSPGFYKVEDYATRVRDVSAHAPDGSPLAVEQPRKNRWRVDAHGASTVVLMYRVVCDERSVTTNFVGDDYAVLNGAPTFITLADWASRPHDVRLELPAGWADAMTALEPAADRAPRHYRAADYDTLVDSPIVAGNPIVQDFEVNGSRHHLVEVGDVRDFDGARAARDLKAIVEAHARLWGGLPFTTYDFLLVFRPGGGGLEHGNSVLATTQAAATRTETGYLRWLNFISHEYCHAFNVKRLRPIELGPFDYEREPRTPSLWISEGFTSYFGNLAVLRAGLSDERAFLASTSSQIAQLQASPGRLVQTLAQSSLDVWTSEGVSGVNTNANTSVSYYLKGQIAGFLLDAKVRRATNGARSLDDVMRLAYRRVQRRAWVHASRLPCDRRGRGRRRSEGMVRANCHVHRGARLHRRARLVWPAVRRRLDARTGAWRHGSASRTPPRVVAALLKRDDVDRAVWALAESDRHGLALHFDHLQGSWNLDEAPVGDAGVPTASGRANHSEPGNPVAVGSPLHAVGIRTTAWPRAQDDAQDERLAGRTGEPRGAVAGGVRHARRGVAHQRLTRGAGDSEDDQDRDRSTAHESGAAHQGCVVPGCHRAEALRHCGLVPERH